MHAQTATQTVTFSVVPISRVNLSAPAATLVVSTASAGAAPTSASMSGSSYAITTNESNQKITAAIDQAMPAGVTLAVWLRAPLGAASAGAVALGTTAADVVTGISATSADALPIVYTMSATPGATISSGRRMVTYTITAGQ